MASTVVGSVTAELILDTNQFIPNLEKATQMVKALGTVGNVNKTAEQISQLEQRVINLGNTIQSQTEKVEKLEAQLKKLDETYKLTGENTSKIVLDFTKLGESVSKTSSSLNSVQGTLDGVKGSLSNVTSETAKLNTEFSVSNRELSQAGNAFSKFEQKIINVHQKLRLLSDEWKSFQSLYNGLMAHRPLDTWIAEMENANVKTRQFSAELYRLHEDFYKLSDLGVAGKWFEQLGMGATKSGEQIAQLEAKVIQAQEALKKGDGSFAEKLVQGFENLKNKAGQVPPELQHIKQDIEQLQSVLNKTAHFRALDNIAEQCQRAMAEVQKIQGEAVKTFREFDLGGTSVYKVDEAVVRFAQNAVNALRKIQSQTQANIQATERLKAIFGQIRSPTFSNSSIQNSTGAIERQREAVAQLKSVYPQADAELIKFAEAQARLGNTLLTNTAKFGEHQAKLRELASAENQASASATKLGTATRQATSGMSAMAGATSKLQGALSSLKMVATALSSMFIWTFGMSLYEATKQTLESKNEMESYLNQMGMGRGSINLFNQGLDETAERFKKLNKYMIGETIASIGMEFDLTANQMKKSMEVVAMVQNEYVRAGRKESEASLAVKDILQGEFLRLSRETGVGKQDLIDTGLWQGDLKDVEGLMDALKKVGESRHWDLFASKCNSLNDVISETKNRISEFGADLSDQVSPAIINSFNMLIDVIDSVTSTWDKFDPTQKIVVGTGAFLTFGTALMMVAGNLSLVDIAQMGYTRSLLATLLHLDIATVKEYGLVTALVAKVTALDGATVAEVGNKTAILARLLGVDASVAKEYGFITALSASTISQEASSVATQLNTLAKEGQVVATSTGTTVTEGFTVVKELEAMLMEENTVLTEANTIAQQMNNIATEEGTTKLWGMVGAMTAVKAIAFVAVIAGIAIALGSLAMEAQKAKEAVDGFYDIVDNGDAYIEEGEKSVQGYTEQIEHLNQTLEETKAQGKDTFNIEKELAVANANKKVAEDNLNDIKNVNESAKKDAENFQKQISMANTDFERKNAEVFKKMGIKTEEATELASTYTQKYLDGMEQMREGTNAYVHELDEGAKHIDLNTDALKKQGVSQENINKYVKEYGQEVLKNAQYQKEWAEGDFWALFKIGLSDIKLAWIDFTAFMSQYEWAKELSELLSHIGDNLKNMYSDDFKRIGEDVKFLCDMLEDLYQWSKGEKGEKTQQYLQQLSGNYPDPVNYMEDGSLNVDKYLHDHTQSVIDNFSKNFGEYFTNPTGMGGGMGITMWILDMLFPGDLSEEIRSKFNEILTNAFNYDWIGGVVGNLLKGGGGGGGGTSTGVAKKIDVNALLGAIFSIEWEGISTWVNDSIVKPFTDAINNFILNPLGSLGITFDVSKFISDLFGLGEGLVDFHQWVYDNIGFPLKTELDLFFQDPIAYVGGMIGNLSTFINGLLSGDTDIYTTCYDWITNNIITPFSNSLYNGLMTIPIISDILALLGLIDQTQPNASEKGSQVGGAFGQAVEQKIASIPIIGDILRILGFISSTQPEAHSQGHGVGSNIKQGVDDGKQGTAEIIRNEMNEIISAIASKVGDAYAKAQEIGSSILNGINSIIQHHSPGVPALLIADEMSEIVNSMSSAEDAIFLQAQNIGLAITTGIQPNTDITFDAEAMAQYQADTMMAMGMAGETVDTTESAFSQLDMNTALTFASIGTTIGTTMTNISNSTKMNYTTIANTTKTQLANMQSQTTKNIGAIKTSWTGMQVALIASAEHIRSETGAKIQSLQNNMATFWRKVQNPALLLGGGTPAEDHSVQKHRFTRHTQPVAKVLKGSGFAGSPNIRRSSSNPTGASTGTGISDKIRNTGRSNIEIDLLAEYLECLQSGKPCYAGGWDFNWSDDIKQALLQWHTHFGEIYDPYLYVGKFENDTFPVRGIAPIAKNYIYDAISRTSYDFYYNQRYSSPLEAWNAGHFNCYDGALLVLALANAFGFSGYMKHGSWSGIAHVWAYVNGIGDIDATAIQGGYGFTSPKVAGHPREMFTHKPKEEKSKGDTVLNITVDLKGANITDENIGIRIGEQVRDEIIDLINPNPATGA